MVAGPLLLFQAADLMQTQPSAGHDWRQLAVANVILLVGICAVAADFPLAGRSGRALLVGIGIPLLLPGPTVLDTFLPVLDPGSNAGLWLLILPDLILLLLLGVAEAGIYLLATRPRQLI